MSIHANEERFVSNRRIMLGAAVFASLALFVGQQRDLAHAADSKPKKPKLEVRALPRVGIAPVEVLAIADLVEGDDLEEFYCPELEWEWDDEAKSQQEIDCPPFEPGMKIERHFTARHLYLRGGGFRIRVRLKRGGRTIASATAELEVRSGPGELE
jgi:hypothetical protein